MPSSSNEADEQSGAIRRGAGGAKDGTKGRAGQQSTCRAQDRVSVSQALDRMRQDAVQLVASYPRQEPDALIGPVRICAGGAG